MHAQATGTFLADDGVSKKRKRDGEFDSGRPLKRPLIVLEILVDVYCVHLDRTATFLDSIAGVNRMSNMVFDNFCSHYSVAPPTPFR